MKNIKSYLEKNSYHQVRVFKLFLYSWVIGNSLLLSIEGDHFWGRNSYIPTLDFERLNLFEKMTNLLDSSYFDGYYQVFICLQILFSILALRNKMTFLAPLLAYFFTLNLDNKISITLDGGNNLIHLLLFYSIFMFPEKRVSQTMLGISRQYLAKLSLLMAQIQVCLLYFVAGHSKLGGDLWINGTALFYTFNVPEYSHSLLEKIVNKWALISVIGSYITLSFQLSFPFLIWSKSLRPYFLFIGTIIHLGISLGMGLLSFGLAMACSYTVFITEEKARRYCGFLKRWSPFLYNRGMKYNEID